MYGYCKLHSYLGKGMLLSLASLALILCYAEVTRNAAYLILRMISSNRCCLSVEAILIKFKTELDLECLRKLKSLEALGQTSNFLWDEQP